MANKTPLEVDEALVKDLDIKPETELTAPEKLAFLDAQIGEMKKMVWRERIDIILSNKLSQSTDKAVANQAKNKINEHTMTLEQFLGSIETLTQLKDEMSGQVSSNPTE